MGAQEKKEIVKFPLKVILTETGASHFLSRNQKLLRFRLADNVEEYGVSMEKFSPKSIQNMILLDYISKMEISMTEFVSARQEIMDLSKIIVYTILYKQFDREIHQSLIKSECVRKYNRSNPGHLIDSATVMSEKQLKVALLHKSSLIEESRKKILDPVYQRILNNSEYSAEEKNIYLLMAEKFLNRLSLMNWYIITLFHQADKYNEIITTIQNLLVNYMEKSQVAEYISLMIMELALNSEKTNMRKAAKKMYQGIKDVDALILDPETRSKITEELKKNYEVVSLAWRLGGGTTSIGKQGRLKITLYNKDDEFQEVKDSIESKKSADTNKRTLIDFYRQSPEGQEESDLGLYYLSYLDSACKKVNIKFESLVNQFTTSGLTVIDLVFNF